MKTMETIYKMIDKDYNYFIEALNFESKSSNILKSIYHKSISKNPIEIVMAHISMVGYDKSVSTVATLVNRCAFDLRISIESINWALSIDEAWDEESASYMGIMANTIKREDINEFVKILMAYQYVKPAK